MGLDDQFRPSKRDSGVAGNYCSTHRSIGDGESKRWRDCYRFHHRRCEHLGRCFVVGLFIIHQAMESLTPNQGAAANGLSAVRSSVAGVRERAVRSTRAAEAVAELGSLD